MNRTLLLVLAASLLLTFTRPVTAEESAADLVTVDEVLADMARVPELEKLGLLAEPPPGHFDRINDATEIARAIAATVNTDPPLYGSRAVTAALLAVHGAWESNNRRCARGDSGRSWGYLQLSITHTSRYLACDPFMATPKWLRLAQRVWCWGNPPGAELAAVESGRCDAAWDKTQHRLAVAKQIADDVAHARLARE